MGGRSGRHSTQSCLVPFGQPGMASYNVMVSEPASGTSERSGDRPERWVHGVYQKKHCRRTVHLGTIL